MKKIMLFALLTLAMVACGNKEEKTTEKIENVQIEKEVANKEEVKNREATEEFVEMSYVNEEKNVSISLNSNDSFETAVLTYRLKDEEKTVVEMEREVSASGVVMKSTNKSENKVEYSAKGGEATFIIDGVEYKTILVK